MSWAECYSRPASGDAQTFGDPSRSGQCPSRDVAPQSFKAQVKREEEASKSDHVLNSLRDGGWGKRWLERSTGVLQALRCSTGELLRALRQISEGRGSTSGRPLQRRRTSRGVSSDCVPRWSSPNTEVHEDRWVTVAEVQAAKAQCAARKESGRDGTVAGMWQLARLAPEEVDKCLVENFNARLASVGNLLADDPGWTIVLVRLLAQIPTPEVFKHLRPIALLSACPKVLSHLTH